MRAASNFDIAFVPPVWRPCVLHQPVVMPFICGAITADQYSMVQICKKYTMSCLHAYECYACRAHSTLALGKFQVHVKAQARKCSHPWMRAQTTRDPIPERARNLARLAQHWVTCTAWKLTTIVALALAVVVHSTRVEYKWVWGCIYRDCHRSFGEQRFLEPVFSAIGQNKITLNSTA